MSFESLPGAQAPTDAPVHDPARVGEGGAGGDMLRAVMRRVASPVTVVTVASHGERRGATIGSFTSVSLDPPLVSFNVQKDSSLHEVLIGAASFAVHLLSADQADLANHFAIPDLTSAEQFRDVPYHEAPDGTPILANASGVLHCEPYAVHDAGDHSLVLGRVLEVAEAEAASPLLYYDRSYRAIGDEV